MAEPHGSRLSGMRGATAAAGRGPRGDPPLRRFLAITFGAVFAVVAVVLVVLAAVVSFPVQTTGYCAVAALLFALLAIVTALEWLPRRRPTRKRGHGRRG